MSSSRAPLGESPSDAELVASVLAGDHDRYAALVARYQAMLFRSAFALVQESDAAADLVQDGLVKAYTSLRSCADPARFSPWVFRIVRNRCQDYLKDRRRQTVPLSDDLPLVADAYDPQRDLEQTELRGVLDTALALLPAPQREAFLLKHVEEYSYEQMAEMLGTSISALKMRVLRAREALQEALRKSAVSAGGV